MVASSENDFRKSSQLRLLKAATKLFTDCITGNESLFWAFEPMEMCKERIAIKKRILVMIISICCLVLCCHNPHQFTALRRGGIRNTKLLILQTWLSDYFIILEHNFAKAEWATIQTWVKTISFKWKHILIFYIPILRNFYHPIFPQIFVSVFLKIQIIHGCFALRFVQSLQWWAGSTLILRAKFRWV